MRTIVKQVYFDDTILQVNEISMNVWLNGSTMYLITLGTKNHIKQITVHDSEMNDYQEFEKSSN